MKKVSIITILDNTNFGTYLQAYALCRSIERLGHKPELVNYCRHHQNVLFILKQGLKKTKNPLKWIARIFYAIKSKCLRNKDLKFVGKYLTSVMYHSFEELQSNPPLADVFMTGSDQVWNSYYNRGIDLAFYLKYAPEGSRKVAYGASIGMKEIPVHERQQTLNLLQEYCSIALRESSALKMLSDLGVTNPSLSFVLDPTLLLNKKEWSEIVSQRMYSEPYLLVYSVEYKEQNDIISEIANKISRQRGLRKVGVYYGGKYGTINGCDYNYYRSTPDIFLSLIYYADYVVVSSFHGTAFSINFEKEFLTVAPDKFNSRIDSLLTLCGLCERKISRIGDFNPYMAMIDYERVRSILAEKRTESINYIKTAIGDCIL